MPIISVAGFVGQAGALGLPMPAGPVKCPRCGYYSAINRNEYAAARCGETVRSRMKIGFLGGSFDPVHFGHLIAAQDVYEQYDLDRLFLVPAAQAPLKPNDIQSSTADRLEMLRAACEWDRRLEISDYELRKGGLSYTIDSVRHFRTQFPQDELFWIIGGDQLPLLHQWREITELTTLVDFIFLERPGHPSKSHPAIPGLRLHRCDGHLIEISSSELRRRMRDGLSLNYFCPQKVIAYIEDKKLYR